MVKKIDNGTLSSIDHIGIALWRAAHLWREQMTQEMAARGYPWHLEARGEVLSHLGPSGRSQTELTAALGMSKQAVQQLIDQLEKDGVVKRIADPKDKRAKRIEFTELGRKDFAERNKVKREIEEKYREKLGTKDFEALLSALKRLGS